MTDKGPRTPTVLIVDDEESIQKLVDYNFRRVGFRTEVLSRGDEAYERVKTDPASLDIVILDIMLPGMDGMEVCKRLRQEQIKLPIILLTARDEEIDRVLGLELGADDYVTKPFSPRELVARARAVLRRTEEQTESRVHTSGGGEQPVTVGNITFDQLRHEVTVGGKPVELTPKEFELLHMFILNRDRVLSRDQLLQQVWGYTVTPDTRIVDAHVSHLREKLESNPKDPVYIRTIRGVGYKFTDGSGRTG